MGLRYENLDGETRRIMIAEIDLDIGQPPGLYISNYLNNRGQDRWPPLLRQASVDGNDDSLANALDREGCFKNKVERRKPKGDGFTMVSVPVTAAQTLAESQFNMYYIRALCVRAINERRTITVYRAKAVDHPRRESEEMIGSQLDPRRVLEGLRATRGVEPPAGIPQPNTGITVRLD